MKIKYQTFDTRNMSLAQAEALLFERIIKDGLRPVGLINGILLLESGVVESWYEHNYKQTGPLGYFTAL